jgi:hypothetical protein
MPSFYSIYDVNGYLYLICCAISNMCDCMDEWIPKSNGIKITKKVPDETKNVEEPIVAH